VFVFCELSAYSSGIRSPFRRFFASKKRPTAAWNQARCKRAFFAFAIERLIVFYFFRLFTGFILHFFFR